VSATVVPGCTQRPGFEVILLKILITSVDGATGLTLGPPMSVVVDGARYLSTYCGGVTDPCDSRIGVPVDGSGSCSVFFEIPENAGDAVFELEDYRYPAGADFTVP
jgi:hypothetical protein